MFFARLRATLPCRQKYPLRNANVPTKLMEWRDRVWDFSEFHRQCNLKEEQSSKERRISRSIDTDQRENTSDYLYREVNPWSLVHSDVSNAWALEPSRKLRIETSIILDSIFTSFTKIFCASLSNVFVSFITIICPVFFNVTWRRTMMIRTTCRSVVHVLCVQYRKNPGQ